MTNTGTEAAAGCCNTELDGEVLDSIILCGDREVVVVVAVEDDDGESELDEFETDDEGSWEGTVPEGEDRAGWLGGNLGAAEVGGGGGRGRNEDAADGLI